MDWGIVEIHLPFAGSQICRRAGPGRLDCPGIFKQPLLLVCLRIPQHLKAHNTPSVISAEWKATKALPSPQALYINAEEWGMLVQSSRFPSLVCFCINFENALQEPVWQMRTSM